MQCCAVFTGKIDHDDMCLLFVNIRLAFSLATLLFSLQQYLSRFIFSTFPPLFASRTLPPHYPTQKSFYSIPIDDDGDDDDDSEFFEEQFV